MKDPYTGFFIIVAGALALPSNALALPPNSSLLATSEAAAAQRRTDGQAGLRKQERRFSMAKDWASEGCEGVTKVSGLDGQSAERIAKLLGEPERKETFRLGERPDEFHVMLQNHYPLTKTANAMVEIQEWTWSKGDCRLTLWLHKKGTDWVGLENVRYPADAEF
jgi:hypothetical protein